MQNLFKDIFGVDLTLDKQSLKDSYFNDYIKGKITKAQLDEKMKKLK